MDYGLKPCPFCGSTKLKIEKKSSLPSKHYHYMTKHYTYSVRCNCCFARGGAIGGDVAQGGDTEWLIEGAVDNWNMRCDNETNWLMAQSLYRKE